MTIRALALFFFFSFLTISQSLLAQSKYEEARALLDKKNFQEAVLLYKDLYNQKPESPEIYQEYLTTLISLKDYKRAEDIIKNQLKRTPNNPLLLLDLGLVFDGDKKEKKSIEQFESALKYINGDDILTQQIANVFSNTGKDEWAIKTFERGAQVMQMPTLYNSALAKLYNKLGDVEKAISLVIEGQQGVFQMSGDESTEATLLEIMGTDTEKQKKAQKAIIKLVNAQPDNYYYTYLLTWLFSVQNNWDQALVQISALEKRSKDKGRLLTEFARKASEKEQYEIAQKAYSTILTYTDTNPWYRIAREGIVHMQFEQLKGNTLRTPSQLAKASKDFDDFFEKYPDAFRQPILQEYAMLEAQYAANLPKGVALLEKAIVQGTGDKLFVGKCKLQLGDYYLIQNKVWDAALLYAQVDKAFREDALGEEARFRNAKLSYYQSDFEQAQGQLSVLKASTSELIANDALFLSVLITENVPPDSNLIPLQRFAYADLLMFQNRDKEAETLLDSIAKAFPKNPLADDILLLRCQLAIKQLKFLMAIDFLKQIVEQHGKDVLADDAMFQIAEINRLYLKRNDEARKYYEQLMIDYPGSSFIQASRVELKMLPIL